jgi:hypothetical protein
MTAEFTNGCGWRTQAGGRQRPDTVLLRPLFDRETVKTCTALPLSFFSLERFADAHNQVFALAQHRIGWAEISRNQSSSDKSRSVGN